MAPRPFPSIHDCSATDPRAIVENLTERFLLGEREPFCWPDDPRRIFAGLSFFRLGGARDDLLEPHLPTALMLGMAGQVSRLAYAAASDGRSLFIALGVDTALAVRFSALCRALLGGPPPVPLACEAIDLAACGALGAISGHPHMLGSDLSRPDAAPGTTARLAAPSPLFALEQALHGEPFVYLVLATPEPAAQLARALQTCNALAEELDRTRQQTGAQPSAARQTLRARELLDLQAQRIEDGLGAGLWRTSLLFGSTTPETVRAALALLAGGLNAGTIARGVAPLRGFFCGRADNAYPTHHNLLLAGELARCCLLPDRDRTGFCLRREVPFKVSAPEAREGDVALGVIVDGQRGTDRMCGVSGSQLARHALVAGMTGSGKTTTVHNMLRQVWSNGMPFMVLEPAKFEYRSLAAACPELLVFQLGVPIAQQPTPFFFNPFYFSDGFSLHTHIDFLKQVFTASFGLFPPTPYLLESAIHRVYERRGWNLALGQHPRGRQRLSFPTLSDLIEEVDAVIDAAGYDSEITRNLKGALRTRLGNLCLGPKGASLDTRDDVPDAVLFNRPVVIELGALGSDEEKALLMGLLITRLFEYREVQHRAAAHTELRHLLVLEEAHRLLRRTVERSSEESNMAHQAVETFCNMFSEIRAYGEGIVVVEQLPSKLAADVVKNSNIKILHRMAPKEDRDLVGDAMTLTEDEKRAVATLRPGLAVVHFAGLDNAVQIAVPFDRGPGAAAGQRALVQPEHAVAARSQSSALPAGLMARATDAVAAAPYLSLLKAPETLRASDGWLLQSVLAAARGQQLTLRELEAHLPWTALQGASSLRLKDRAVAARLSVETALLRRALHYQWNDDQLATLVEVLRREPATIGQVLSKTLQTDEVADAMCESCANRCRYSFEASLVAASSEFKDDLALALRKVAPGDGLQELCATIDAHVQRTLDLPAELAALLRRCALRAGAQSLGLARKTSTQLLDALSAAAEGTHGSD